MEEHEDSVENKSIEESSNSSKTMSSEEVDKDVQNIEGHFKAQNEVETSFSPMFIIALLFVFLADYFIFRGSGGAGYASFLFAVVLLLPKVFTERKYCFISALIIIFCLRNLWQSTDFTPLLGFCMLFVLGSAITNNSLHILELIGSFIVSCCESITKAALVIRRLTNFPIFQVLSFRNTISYTVPLAVVIVFLTVFGLANPVISNLLSSISNYIAEYFGSFTDWVPSFSQVIFWFLSLCAAMVILVPSKITSTSSGEDIIEMKEDEENLNRSFLTARNTLVSVNVLFLVYNLIDGMYLVGQSSLPEGIAYSDYARGGTFWLTVALALTSLVLGIIFSSGLNFHRQVSEIKTLTWIWTVQNFAIALFTFRRLFLYIDYNGLTRMRILGAVGICLVIVGLIIVVWKIREQKNFLWMIRRQLIAFGLAVFVLQIFPSDYLIHAVNVPRILAAGENDEEKMRPATLLARHPISAEGLPGLIPLLDSKDTIIREGVAGILLREMRKIKRYQSQYPRWTYQEFSRVWALSHLEKVKSRINEIIPDGDDARRVRELEMYTARWW